MTLQCPRCGGRILLDRAYCNKGHVELFCIICGKRWEAHRTSLAAIAINNIENRRLCRWRI